MATTDPGIKNDVEINAEDVKHYIFQTPKAFLDKHNARNDVSDILSAFGVHLYIIYQGEVLMRWTPDKKIRLPTHQQRTQDDTYTIAELCHRLLRQDMAPFQLKSPQIMEPAFKMPALKPAFEGGVPTCLCLKVLITITERPKASDAGMMVALESIRPFQIRSNGNPFDGVYSHDIIERVNSLSKTDLCRRFPNEMEFLHMRMGFVLCFLESFKVWKSPGDFWVVITQRDKEQNGGFLLFETSEGPVRMLMNDPGVILKTDEEYSIKGFSVRRASDKLFATSLVAFSRDRVDDGFEESGRLKIGFMETELTARLQKVVVTGGYRSIPRLR